MLYNLNKLKSKIQVNTYKISLATNEYVFAKESKYMIEHLEV